MLSPLASPTGRVFVSYARNDYILVKRLQPYFEFLTGYYNVDFFIDTALESGERWLGRIREEISSCNIGLLLLSPAFLASTFIQDEELRPLLRRAESEETVLIPVIGREVSRETAPLLNTYQALNPTNEPLADLNDRQIADLGIKLMGRVIDGHRTLERSGLI
jgi:hypothetical protein